MEESSSKKAVEEVDSWESQLTEDILSRRTVLASMVPDEILNSPTGRELREYNTVLLMGDVSGFTYLCDQYTKVKNGGNYKITSILNQYIGGMVKIIYKYKGDVLNYSGDAYLAMWKFNSSAGEVECVKLALDCALFIQKHAGRYETDVKVLTVKIAVALGKCYLAIIGTDAKREFIVYGDAVMQVKEGGNLCQSADVLVSDTVWAVASKTRRYSYEVFHTNRYVRVTGYVKVPQDVKDADKAQTAASQVEDIFELRPSLKKALIGADERLLSRYLMTQVTKGIEHNQTVESLTELRQVVIVFTNVVSNTDMTLKELRMLVNRCYVAVMKLVEATDGAVNKVSLFDKDLMFLSLFGLRYFKQGMVALTALKCACSLRQVLSKFEDVKSVSVGVTTGIVYCGVVGHHIRKEYTAMGLAVNKAARLMVAYENKVTCDRETFLRSRMTYHNFELQEPKPLKGISNVGPIYMYNPNPIKISKKGKTAKIFKYPLLGRDEEILLYKYGMSKLLKYNQPNSEYLTHPSEKAIAFYGEARYGKSRLLDELSYVSRNKVRVIRIDLVPNTRRVPYSAWGNIFLSFFGFSEESLVSEKQAILFSLLNESDAPQTHFCVLNEIFQVNFPLTKEFINSQSAQIDVIKNDILKHIVDKCITQPTILLLDDAEFVDDCSWSIMDMLCKNHFIYLVFTLGFGAQITSTARQFLSNNYVLGHKLKSIHRWFHVGIACQVLDVTAVPYDLLTLIEKESNGNPGWIENYLLSSFQAALLYIKNLTVEEMNAHGLMLAPSYMIRRSTYESSLPEVKQWVIYQSKILEGNVEEMECDFKNKILPACLKHNAPIEEIPQSMDSLILLIFDRLTEFTKTFLKCCSTIGEVFKREMVTTVLQIPEGDEISRTVQTLFDLRILTCASRYMGHVNNIFTARKYLLNTTDDPSVACYCNETGKPTMFAQYASCNFFCFRAKSFRATTYALLSTPEKRHYHSLAAFYLEGVLRRCDSCKGLRFRHVVPSNKSISHKARGLILSEGPRQVNGDDLLSFHRKSDAVDWVGRRKGMFITRNVYVSTVQLITYAQINMAECKCQEILKAFYTEILQHSVGSEYWDKSINVILKLVPLCMSSFGVKNSIQLLSDALNYMDWIAGTVVGDSQWKIDCTYGAIHTLFGITYFKTGHPDSSVTHYMKAFNYFGIRIPLRYRKRSLMLKIMTFRIKHLLNRLEWSGNKGHHNKSAIIKMYTSLCLLAAGKVFALKEKWDKMRYCVIWSLLLTLRSRLSFHNLCTVVNGVFSISARYPDETLYTSLEHFVLRVLASKGTEVEFHELQSISKLYYSIFVYKLFKGKLESANAIGQMAFTISLPARTRNVRYRLVPWLVIGKMMTLNLEDVYECLEKLESWSESDPDESSLLWYYAICVYLFLYLGVHLVKMSEIEEFFANYGERICGVKDRLAEHFLTLGIWLWCVRNDYWDKAKMWSPRVMALEYEKCIKFWPLILMLLEGLTIHANLNVGLHSSVDAQVKIQSLKKFVEGLSESMPSVLPRYFHLVGYHYYRKNQSRLGDKYFKLAKRKAKHHGNNFELYWIDHHQIAWSGLQQSSSCRWIKVAPIVVNGTKYHIQFFTLPMT